MSLLSIAQDVTALVGIQPPPSVAVNTDTIYAQVRAVIQQATNDLFHRHDWQVMTRVVEYTTVAGERQAGFLSADYDRMAAGHTLWDAGRDEQIYGPLSPTEWAGIQQRGSGFINQYWRFIGRDVFLFPAMGAGQVLRFEYLGKNVIKAVDGTERARWEKDDDTSFLPEELITLCAIWKWKSGKGFAYAEDMRNYELALERYAGAEASMAPIVISDGYGGWDFGYAGSPTPSGPINAAALRVRASNGYGN